MFKINKLLKITLYMNMYIGIVVADSINKLDKKLELVRSEVSNNFSEVKIVRFPANVSVSKVDIDDSDNIATWAEIVLESFFYAPSEQDLLDWLSDLKLQILSENLSLYFGLYNNEPVAVAIVINNPLISTLHWVATKPAYRDKGIGAAVLQQILLDAEFSGFNVLVLLSSIQLKNLH